MHKLSKLGNHVAGTPAYMSPEQVSGEVNKLDSRTDIWSLGVMLYELLSGRRPFNDSPIETCFAEIRQRKPESIDCGELEGICFRAMSKDASNRFRSASEMADQLRSISQAEPKKSSLRRLIAAASSAVLVMLIAFAAKATFKNGERVFVSEESSRPESPNSVQGIIDSARNADSASVLGSAIPPLSSGTERPNTPADQRSRDIESARGGIADLSSVESESGSQDIKWKLSQTLIGSLSHVYGADLSSDGFTVVSGGADQNLRFWDARTGELVREIRRHGSEVGNTMFLNDGERTICSVGRHRRVEIWHRSSASPEVVFENDFNGELWSIAMSPDDRMLLTSGSDGIVMVWDVETAKQVREIRHGLPGGIQHVSVDHNGTHVACVNRSRQLALCDISTGSRIQLLTSSERTIQFADFSPTGQILATAGGDGVITLWETDSGQATNNLHGHAGNMRRVSFSANGNFLASSGDDGKVTIWSMKTLESVATLSAHLGQPAGVAFVREGLTVISWGDNREINVWSALESARAE